MIPFRLTKFLNSSKYSLELEEFNPKGGIAQFLKDLCAHLGASYGDWYNGVESGIGHMTYKGYKLGLFWTDFPDYFSFDCRDESMAIELKLALEDFFATAGISYTRST